MEPRAEALRRWQSDELERHAATPAERLSAAVSAALAATLARDYTRADVALGRAQAIVSDRSLTIEPRAQRAVAMLGVQSLLARGDAAGAARALQPLAGDGSRALALLAAEVANAQPPVEREARQRSAEELQTWTSLHPRDARAWSMLGSTWAGLDQPLRALRAEAEARVAVADTVGAIDRLRAGQQLARRGGARDHIEAAVIDARLRDLEAQRRAEMAEERGAR
jgi:predicted Zn-dependent protease